MKKILTLIAVSLFFCSCSEELEINKINTNYNKKESSNEHLHKINFNVINNTDNIYYLNAFAKPRYHDSNGLHDPDNIMPNGLAINCKIIPNSTKIYSGSFGYPFKQLIYESNLTIEDYNTYEYDTRYKVTHIELKHPVIHETIKMSPFESYSNLIRIYNNYYTNFSLISPWGHEVYYDEGPSEYTVNLPDGSTQLITFKFNFNLNQLTLTFN